MPDHDEIVRLYGPWRRRTPRDAATLLSEYSGRWWIAGGWAIDAFVRSDREHGDLDIGIPREDTEAFVDYMTSRLDVWAAAGSLTPMLPAKETRLPNKCGNLWLRANGADPWEYDVLLEHVRGGNWFYKRAPSITRPLTDCLWESNSITYLRPEVQLLLKAKHARANDTSDLERCLPHLEPSSRTWLTQSLNQEHPGHPWLELLALS